MALKFLRLLSRKRIALYSLLMMVKHATTVSMIMNLAQKMSRIGLACGAPKKRSSKSLLPFARYSEAAMTTKSNILKSAFIAASISAGIAVAYAFQPAKVADDNPQVVITAQKYEVLKRTCHETCIATVKAGDYSIYVEYALDDASVEFLDILNVVHFDKTINAYVDRSEERRVG